jgi:hypothetical protein
MTEIKYFVCFGSWRPELLGEGRVQKAMKDWEKKVEEAGMKLKFWGAPYGTSENAICVYKGNVDDYNKLAFMQAPYTASRTIMVLTW